MQAIEVDFLGTKIKMKSQSDEAVITEVLELARIKIQEAKQRAPKAAPQYVALVALFDMCEDYVRAKKKVSENRAELTESVDSLLAQIENELK